MTFQNNEERAFWIQVFLQAVALPRDPGNYIRTSADNAAIADASIEALRLREPAPDPLPDHLKPGELRYVPLDSQQRAAWCSCSGDYQTPISGLSRFYLICGECNLPIQRTPTYHAARPATEDELRRAYASR